MAQEFIISDKFPDSSCTLKCEKCVSQIPHMKKRRGNRAFGEIKEELENVFSVIDFIEDSEDDINNIDSIQESFDAEVINFNNIELDKALSKISPSSLKTGNISQYE